MKIENYTAQQNAAIENAAAVITEAATASLVAIVKAKASIAAVIREQVAILTKAKIADKDIAAIVKESVGNACASTTISRTLTECGIRLRGKRSDAGHLRSADALLTAALEAEPEKAPKAPKAPKGHTPETLAALLQSIEPEIVAEALEIAGLSEIIG